MADDGRIVIFALAGLGFGIYSFYQGLKRRIERQLIENTPTSKIRGLAMGPVEIYGEALQPENIKLKSPLSKKDCVYYRYRVEEERGSGKSRHWVTLSGGERREHFYLRDKTGTVLIDPKHAEIEIPADFSFESGLGRDPPKLAKDFLKESNLSFEGIFGINKKMRFNEWYIAPKDKLYVFGSAMDNPFVDDLSAKKNEDDIMITRGRGFGRTFFYISDKHEKDILSSFRWKIIGGMYGGAALILGCLFVIFLYFGVL